jgi:hypothetical protein
LSGKNYNTGKEGEKSSWDIMAEKGFYRPTKKERSNIAKAFAMVGKSIEWRGFDLVNAGHALSLNDPTRVPVDSLILYELKTAGRNRKAALKANFHGLGFTLTANEEHNHSILGDKQFKFIFLDLKTGNCLCCNYSDWYDRSRVYLTKSIFVTQEVPNGVVL